MPDLAHLASVLDDARAGRGGALALVGRPGVGKTAIVDHAVGEAADFGVVRATGVASEADLAWSGLASILDPLVDAALLDGLPAPRSAALRRVLLLDEVASDGVVDLRAVAVATLDVLTTRAEPGRPLLVVVDDLHWLDDESARVLGYVARRLESDPIALVATSRAVSDLPTRTVVDLDRASADQLLRRSGLVAPLRARVLDELGTNPLLLVGAVAALSPEVRSGEAPAPDVLPLPPTLAAGARRRVLALASPVRRALLVLASAPGAALADPAPALAAAGASDADLGPARAAGVVVGESDGPRLTFAHPTLRAAVVEAASPAERREAHAALARVAPTATARAIHRALAADGPSEAVAAALEGAAEEIWGVGAPASAATELERAADLSEDRDAGTWRRARAAAARLVVGDTHRARDLLATARAALGPAVTAEPPVRARVRAEVALLEGRALHIDGRDAESAARLTALATEVEAEDPESAARAHLEALVPLVRVADQAGVLAAVAALDRVAPRCSAPVARRVEVVTAALGALVSGEAEPAVALTRRLVAEEGAVRCGPFVGAVVAPLLSYRTRGGAVLELLVELEAALRDAAALVPLAQVLSAIQLHHHGRDEVAAVVAADEAIELATELRAPRLATVAAYGQALAASAAGDRAALERAQVVLDASGEGADRAMMTTARATLLLAEGRAEEAVTLYEGLVAEQGFGRHLSRWEPEYVEALVRARRPEAARAVLATLDAEGVAEHSPARFGRVRGMVAVDEDEARRAFSGSLAVSEAAGDRLAVGRTLLCWGEWARRHRRRAEARQHLERAVAELTAVGARPWARRAADELAAAGGVVAGDQGPDHPDLTARELRVARLAAAGASNREIGAAVFLSERTVEAHLSAVYRKLGVRNRRELSARAVRDADLRD